MFIHLDRPSHKLAMLLQVRAEPVLLASCGIGTCQPQTFYWPGSRHCAHMLTLHLVANPPFRTARMHLWCRCWASCTRWWTGSAARTTLMRSPATRWVSAYSQWIASRPLNIGQQQVSQQSHSPQRHMPELLVWQVLLPGHLLMRFTREKLEDCLAALKDGIRRDAQRAPESINLQVTAAFPPALGFRVSDSGSAWPIAWSFSYMDDAPNICTGGPHPACFSPGAADVVLGCVDGTVMGLSFMSSHMQLSPCAARLLSTQLVTWCSCSSRRHSRSCIAAHCCEWWGCKVYHNVSRTRRT